MYTVTEVLSFTLYTNEMINNFTFLSSLQALTGRNNPACDHSTPQFQIQ